MSRKYPWLHPSVIFDEQGYPYWNDDPDDAEEPVYPELDFEVPEWSEFQGRFLISELPRLDSTEYFDSRNIRVMTYDQFKRMTKYEIWRNLQRGGTECEFCVMAERRLEEGRVAYDSLYRICNQIESRMYKDLQGLEEKLNICQSRLRSRERRIEELEEELRELNTMFD